MHLKPSIATRQAQTLAMSAEVIQSIKLLQYGHEELQDYLRSQVERNPLISLEDRSGDLPAAETPQETGDITGITRTSTSEGSRARDESVVSVERGRPLSASISGRQTGAGPSSDEGWRSLEETCASDMTLRDHLSSQLAMSRLSAADYRLTLEIVESLDDDGYLRRPLSEIARSQACAEEDVEQALGIVHTLEPTGVGARDLAECLRLQLSQRQALTPAMASLLDNLPLLAGYDLLMLSRRCGVSAEEILRLASIIRRCDPRPGSGFNSEPNLPAMPDVDVTRRSDGTFTIELNTALLPRVLVDRQYYAEVSAEARSGQESRYVSDCLREARWLTRKLDQRARTIHRVATEIVIQQREFFLHGPQYLKPLRIRDVADSVGMHESTVCRASANKFMMTPFGLFEFGFFFMNSIASNDGGDDFSAETIRHKVRQLVEQETPDSIMTDDDIVDALRIEGVRIARRTVAKYRDMLHIPSSSQRRRQKRAQALAGVL